MKFPSEIINWNKRATQLYAKNTKKQQSDIAYEVQLEDKNNLIFLDPYMMFLGSYNIKERKWYDKRGNVSKFNKLFTDKNKEIFIEYQNEIILK